MEIKTLTPSDLQYIPSLQPPEWANILPYIEFYLDSPICFPIKIEHDDRAIGIGTTIYHKDTVWLAHIIVHPEFRNKGLGKRITKALIDSVDHARYETIYLIATDLGAPVYTGLGFETETNYAFLKDGRCEYKIHDNVKQFNEAHREQLLALDRRASGEDRIDMLSEHIKNAFVFEKDNSISGFYLPSMMDGPIIAEDNEAGIELMKLRFQTNPVTILPEDNTAAIAFAEQNNFKIFRKAKRMRLGKKRVWQPEFYYNRISGQLG